MSEEEFIPFWTSKVSERFDIPFETLSGLYDSATDEHHSEEKLRAIWQYGSSKGVVSIPTMFINFANV